MFRPENDPGSVARSLWLRTAPECHRTLRTLMNGQPRPGVEEGRCLKGRCSRYEGEEQQVYPHLANRNPLFACMSHGFDRDDQKILEIVELCARGSAILLGSL